MHFKISRAKVLETHAADISTILADCKTIAEVANSSHRNNEALMTHEELLFNRNEVILAGKRAKREAGLHIIDISQTQSVGCSIDIKEVDVIEIDSDGFDRVENSDSDSDSDDLRHGTEPSVRVGKKIDRASVSSKMETIKFCIRIIKYLSNLLYICFLKFILDEVSHFLNKNVLVDCTMTTQYFIKNDFNYSLQKY